VAAAFSQKPRANSQEPKQVLSFEDYSYKAFIFSHLQFQISGRAFIINILQTKISRPCIFFAASSKNHNILWSGPPIH
jgi:hypothetical protein